MNDSAATSAAFVVRQGNNMPVHAPLIPDPFVPYHCPGNANLFVICRTDPARLAKYLAPTPFEAIDDRYVIYVSDFSNCDKAVYMDTGIIVLVRFGERTGGYYLFVYEDNEVAISAGRDLWGYAKKYAEPTMTVEGGRVSSRTVRHGEAIIELDCDLSKPVADLPRLVTTPHLNIHVQPGPDGRVLNKRVIERDTSPDFELTSEQMGEGRVTLRGIATDPLHEIQPREVLGARYVIGDFHATEKNGWGRTIAEL